MEYVEYKKILDQAMVDYVNKLIHAILTSNGHCEEYMLGDELQNSKFSILIQPKYEYTMAYLKLKFREQGLDIEDLTVNQDLSRFKKDGISKIIIDYKIKKYEKSEERKTESASNNALYQHPKAKELNDLEKQKKLAKENNDMVAYQSAQAEIRRIIQKTRAELSLQQEDSMSIDEIIAFIKVKMNEAKVLNDKDEYNYWKANLKSLEEQKVQTVEVLQAGL